MTYTPSAREANGGAYIASRTWESASSSTIERHTIAGYILPNVLHNSDDGRRLVGLDVPEMTDDQLFAERERVTRALAEAIADGYGCRITLETTTPPYFELAVDWLHRRARLVQTEMRRRRGSDR